MADLLTTQRDYRRRLLALDREVAGELVRLYARVQAAIEDDLRALTQAIRLARQAGEDVNPQWLFREQRYRLLLDQVERAHFEASRTATGIVTQGQNRAVPLGQEAARALVQSLYPPQIPFSWSVLPTGALEALAGSTSGGPLLALFDALGPHASVGIRDALFRGLALGQNPNVIARQIRTQFGLSLTRALTISRTEMLRAYRTSQSESYRANRDVVKTQMWHCALDERSCVVCISQHGSVWPVGAAMETHPRCRCSWVPVTKTWAELGYEGIRYTNPDVIAGSDWFGALPSEKQAAILGPGRLAAYQQGLSLADMVGRRVDRRWGAVRYVLPLRTIRDRAAERVA